MTSRPQSAGTFSRRAVLAGGAAGACLLAAYGAKPPPPIWKRFTYGPHPAQHAWLGLPPQSEPWGTVVVIHGGSWQAPFTAMALLPMAEKFVAMGLAAWVIEYRRVGAGGGWPATFEDVAAVIDLLGDLPVQHTGVETHLLTRNVVIVGHSAGGHLAVWAVSRRADGPGGPLRLPVRSAVSLSGVLNLRRWQQQTPFHPNPVDQLMGGPPARQRHRYALADPTQLVPAPVPVWVCQTTEDSVVSADIATTYVDAAREAGGRVRLVHLPGDHGALVDPGSPAWPRVRELIRHRLGA